MKKTNLKYLIYALVAVLMTGCYPMRRVGLIQERENLPQYENDVFHQYKLQQNDEVVIRVLTSDAATEKLFNNGQSNQTTNAYSYRIYEDGTIDVPFLSHVKVEGLTLNEAEKKIDAQLAEYVSDAHCKLALTTGTFCVIGDAGRGYFPIYKERLTIYQALALSGGINATADFAHVKILRKTPDGTKIVEFDIRSKSIIDSEYYYIYPNDIIYLDVSKRRFWGSNSYTEFLGVITSSLSLLMSIWNIFAK